MNEYKVLIYHYSVKNQRWYDATNNVVWYADHGTAWKVKFANSDQYYFVSFANMKIYENPKKIDFAALFYKGSPCYRVQTLISFNDTYYKIFYENGHICVAHRSELKIIKDTFKSHPETNNVFSYYRRVVQETAETDEDLFLIQQFENVDFVSEESVLSLYLRGKLDANDNRLRHPIISPFGINLSQSKALDMMFKNRISVVEGPPGTGKTQTILNFIANALINKYSVAVVSNNNSATDNVYEKLGKYGYSFVAAPLGNVDNVDKFFEEYKSEIPTFEKGDVSGGTLKNYYLTLPRYFSDLNRLKKAIANLKSIELEYKHFLNDNKDLNLVNNFSNVEKVKTKSVLDTILKFKETNKKLNFWAKFILRYKLKLKKTFFTLSEEEIILYLNNLYYLSKINEVNNEIKDLKERIKTIEYKQILSKYIKYSKIYFENQLCELFSNSNRDCYQRDNYKRKFVDFVKDYPVVLSSTYSLARCSQKGFLFDYLIVDESSQVNMASAILAMGVAKNIIIVGDIKQLPQIDDSDFKRRNDELLNQFNVSPAYSYYGNSIMSSVLNLYKGKLPKVLLKEHYRCNPDIITFCNKRFYDNELVIYTSKNDDDCNMKVIKTVPGNFARKNPEGPGLYNQREIDEIKHLLDAEKLEDIGVISPYRYHTSVIKEQLKERVDASTIHKFQGREKKTIIFSSVINEPNDFVENDNLINVAVSRAVDKFYLITSDKVYNSKRGVLADLINYIEYSNPSGESESGQVKSIYDILYSDYQQQLESFRRKYPSDDFDSENITKVLIQNILAEKQYNDYGLKMHVSLFDFIVAKNISLTREEYNFFKNPNTHVDFLIFNKMSKKPILVIEVDGVSFHEQQKTQIDRDNKKNSILAKANIPIIRLKTNGSDEEGKIREALNN